jgi:CIC family chloride channel protein
MGMAGVVAGATGAAITAIVMIFEMTLDYNVILPMTITVAISYGVRKFLCNDSIYTLKLTRRGHRMPEAMQSNFPLVRMARDIMESQLSAVPAGTPLNELPHAAGARQPSQFLLAEREGKVIGVLRMDFALDMLSRAGATKSIGEIADTNFKVVAETSTLFNIISKMRSDHATLFVVASGSPPVSVNAVKGVISKERIADAMTETISLSSE